MVEALQSTLQPNLLPINTVPTLWNQQQRSKPPPKRRVGSGKLFDPKYHSLWHKRKLLEKGRLRDRTYRGGIKGLGTPWVVYQNSYFSYTSSPVLILRSVETARALFTAASGFSYYVNASSVYEKKYIALLKFLKDYIVLKRAVFEQGHSLGHSHKGCMIQLVSRTQSLT